jgi:hypothetical protein
LHIDCDDVRWDENGVPGCNSSEFDFNHDGTDVGYNWWNKQ